jgi:hypothetical protein
LNIIWGTFVYYYYYYYYHPTTTTKHQIYTIKRLVNFLIYQ